MKLLRIETVTKSYQPGTLAVDGVRFSVAEGEIICLLGPSGCGKTTLLRIIAGLEIPDAGDVLLDGDSILTRPPHQRDFGMMFQDFALFPHKNVFDNIAFGLEMRGDSRAHIQHRVADMLKLVDLPGFDARRIDQLSGGEQQRVALARSLAPGPRLLMLDEPLGALDRALRERLMLDLRTILKQVGLTAIYVTHDQTEAFAIADRIVVMNAGRIEQIDTPQHIYAQPASPFVARFLGFQNILSGTLQPDGRVETTIGEFSQPISAIANIASPKPMTLLLKPDAASFTPGATAQPTPQGTITAISFRGRFYQVWVEVRGTQLMFEFGEIGEWQVGDQVGLGLDMAGVVIW